MPETGEADGVLVLTGSPPGNTGVGQLYMRSICALVDEPVTVAALGARSNGPDANRAGYPTLSMTARFEPAWFPPRTGAHRLLNRIAVGARLQPHARRLLQQVDAFANVERPRAVLAVLDTPTAMLMAGCLAERLNRPLYSIVWDMPEYLLGQRGHAGVSAAPILKAFERAMRRSDRVAVVSEAMQAAFRDRYGVDALILRQPIDPEWSLAAQAVAPDTDADFTIGFAGSVTARDEMEILFQALDRCGWMLGGRRVRVRVYGLRVVCQATTARCIEYRGYLPEVADVVTGLAGCDLLFLPQPFGARHELFSRYSFPTKLTTYLAAGRPILLLAPEYATLSRYFGQRGMPLVCNEQAPDAVAGLLQQVAIDAGLREEARSRAEALAQSEFNEGVTRACLARFVGKTA